MDFTALQHKLFALDPSDRAEDLRRLTESAGGLPPASVQTEENFLQESVKVQQGTMPIEGDYSLSDFARLAGVTLNEAQKTGSAGQLKGKDPMPKAKARGKHPHVDKLVGEDVGDAFKKGYDNYNTPAAIGIKNPIKQIFNPKSKDTDKPTLTNPKYQARAGDWQGFLKQHTAQLQKIAADTKKKSKFDQFMAKMDEDVQEAAYEINTKKQDLPKQRNPVATYAQRSGAGAHKDQNKKTTPMRKEKHKGKEYTTESIKEMLYRKLTESK